MTEAIIPFESQDQLRTLFGSRDRYLKQVKENVGIDVVIRNGQLKLTGNKNEVARGVEIFQELQAIVNKHGHLEDAEVREVLEGPRYDASPASRIRLSDNSRSIEPRTEGQAVYLNAIKNNDIVVCTGPAGTGKTYLAVAKAIEAIRREDVRRIVLVRPAVEAGEKLGFLPGDMIAKVNPYVRPLLDALNDMLDFETVKKYMENDVVEIAPLAFMRGRTLNHTFMILDEAQNTTVTQMKMFLTRMGMGSKIVITGDTTQNDLPPHVTCGLTDASTRLRGIPGVGHVELSGHDIIRNRLVREIVKAYDEEGVSS